MYPGEPSYGGEVFEFLERCNQNRPGNYERNLPTIPVRGGHAENRTGYDHQDGKITSLPSDRERKWNLQHGEWLCLEYAACIEEKTLLHARPICWKLHFGTTFGNLNSYLWWLNPCVFFRKLPLHAALLEGTRVLQRFFRGLSASLGNFYWDLT